MINDLKKSTETGFVTIIFISWCVANLYFSLQDIGAQMRMSSTMTLTTQLWSRTGSLKLWSETEKAGEPVDKHVDHSRQHTHSVGTFRTRS